MNAAQARSIASVARGYQAKQELEDVEKIIRSQASIGYREACVRDLRASTIEVLESKGFTVVLLSTTQVYKITW